MNYIIKSRGSGSTCSATMMHTTKILYNVTCTCTVCYDLITFIRLTVRDKERDIANLLSKITELTKENPNNIGKGLDEVQKRQERRKIAVLHDGCKRALYFADSFGIDLLNIVFRTRATKKL